MKTLFAILLVFILSISTTVFSATFYVTEKIDIVAAKAASSPDRDWIALKNTSGIGTCGVSSGLVVLRLKDNSLADRQISVALTARMGNIPVTVIVVDTNKDSSGYCYLSEIRLE